MFSYRIKFALLAVFALVFSCSWEDKSPVSPYPDIRYRVYFHEDRDVIEADYCRIIVKSSFENDSLSAQYNDYAIIVAPDSNYYFYSPKQGDLEDLSLRLSVEALLMILRENGYFALAPKRPLVFAENPVGIEISGSQTSPELSFLNQLNRFTGVSSGGGAAVLPSIRNAGLTQFLSSELGPQIKMTPSAMLPYSVNGPDTAYLYNASSLVLLLEPLSSPYFAENLLLLNEGFVISPRLFANLAFSDQLNIFAIVLEEICADSLYLASIQTAESLLTGNIEPLAGEFEVDLSSGLEIEELALRFRSVLGLGLFNALIEGGEEIHAVAKSLQNIALNIDSLNGVVETYSIPPFGKWTGRTPSVIIDLPASGGLFERGVPISFSGHAIDPIDGSISPENLSWRSSVDGFIGTGEYISFAPTSGEHLIILSAVNSDSFIAEDTIQLTVDNGRPPTVSILLPASGSRHADTAPVEFSGYAVDYEDGELFGSSLEWRSSRDGVLGTGTLLSAPLSIGNHRITLRATDSDGLTAEDEIDITVFRNTPPRAWIIMPQDGDTLTMIGINIFVGGATDAEDGLVEADNLIWTSNRSGVIGTGFYFTATLMVGWHTIILTASDSGGLTGSDTIQVYVKLF